MTYCVGMALKDGLVMVSDSRTNAGVDHISVFRKLNIWKKPGERIIALTTAGNLAITQAVIDLVTEGLPLDDEEDIVCMDTVKTMRNAARLIGKALRIVEAQDGEALRQQGVDFSAAILLGGQIAGGRMRLFQIYTAGNFIEATEQTPYFQIGETKYGKPILDRVIQYDLSLEDAVKLSLISMDSTLRSNISVGPPLDVITIKRDAFELDIQRTIEEDDPYLKEIQKKWGQALRSAFKRIPPMPIDVPTP
ncbi:proteasome-type protease [Sneathiella glossodoripedis]|uniref:proteasome-type protease n=1 Tax=Sneathiella glossodoripedis TaxID=418853 RepID=UPI000470138D|nr:proteasome-type protease [Sneathiella glossodoripedis]